ncbi:hypothetical protein A2Z56_02415 [Candidatus Kaiserbacteria bacterium RIFCSPHIGHO2_12_45_16]|nr:MAG: hypothetical protein A2Z56_02415 [Candidatus Kaiserbacteria bacterium RIFCSPHIGHO2_12_45_16]
MGDQDYSYNEIGDGLQLVAAAGTAEALSATSVPCRAVLINARPENTDQVVVGASTVVAAAATRRGIAIVPGGSVLLRVTDVNKIYVDAVVTGEGVSFVYFK